MFKSVPFAKAARLTVSCIFFLLLC